MAGLPDAGIQTGSVVGLHDVPAIYVAGTDSAIVGALWKHFCSEIILTISYSKNHSQAESSFQIRSRFTDIGWDKVTWGPGKPFLGHPKGCPSWSRRVYSCSSPRRLNEVLSIGENC